MDPGSKIKKAQIPGSTGSLLPLGRLSQRRRFVVATVQGGLIISFFIALLVAFCITTGFHYHGDWKEVTRFVPMVMFACSLLGVFGLISLTPFQPNTISFNEQSIMVGRRMFGGGTTTVSIPWESVLSIKVNKRLALSLEPKYSLEIVTTSTKYNLRFEDFASSVPAGNFFNAARFRAPRAIADLDLPTQLASQSSQSYTQLWLQYFSQPSLRSRITELNEGLVLKEGKYRLVGRLGGGGQGNVYLAITQENSHDIEVVLKEYVMPMHKGSTIMDQTLKKLQREAELLQTLDHPNIVKCMDCFVEDYRGYVVLEYVDGRSVKDLVQLHGAMPQSQVIDIALQLCKILRYLRSLEPPVVHRDITPDNVLQQDTGELKLVDFNLAHKLETCATATVVGKHAFIPPEQFRGKPVPASDIYAFGCTLYYLLTGTEPEPISASHPRKLVSAVSEEMDQLVSACTQPELSKRIDSLDDIEKQLNKMGGRAV